MNTVFIYALNEPDTGRTRYIGKAADPYARYEAHLDCNLRDKTHKGNWVRSLLALGQNPILEVLDEVPENEWQLWEREWIRLYRALGFSLTNGTDGGDGITKGYQHSSEAIEKISVASIGNIRRLGIKQSPETREKISSAQKGRELPPEFRAHIGMSHKHTPESRAKISGLKKGNKYWLGKRHAAESLVKIGAASRGRKYTSESRVKMCASQQRRREKERISNAV